MSAFHSLFCLMMFLLGTNVIWGQQIVINEFMASNSQTITDNFGNADDWVELYNPGNIAVNVGGMYLTDDLTNPTAWQIPFTNPGLTTINPGEYLLLWFDGEPAQGVLHIDAKLGAGGEDVALVASDGVTVMDAFTFGQQTVDVSQGRFPNGTGDFVFFTDPTPGAPNTSNPGLVPVATPELSLKGGIYNAPVFVSISTNEPGAKIYYTTDGSVPTENSALYSFPLQINVNTSLRARAFRAFRQPSAVATQTYLFNISHTFPVIAYTGDPVEIFDPATGIYPNYTQDIEINVNAEMYEPDGTQAFNQVLESEVMGTGSASLPQKQLALKAKASLGNEVIPYAIFPDSEITEYRSLSLRNSGQDWNYTMFRDAMASSLIRDLTDVDGYLQKPDMFLQNFRPGVLYLNGEYWGIHNIRERMDKRYLKVHFNLDDTDVDFLENLDEIKEGDLNQWNQFKSFYNNTDFSNDDHFAQLAEMMDVDHYKDYIVFNLYIDNADWPGNNSRRWRKKAEDEKWRWLTWDLDFSFGLHVEGQPFNSGIFTSNSLERLLNPTEYQHPNPKWSTDLFNNLIENETWRHDFINRMADQLNILYTPERINKRIDEFVTIYEPEIQKHHDRWTSGWHVWDQNVAKLRGFANGRANVVRNFFVQEFSEISGTSTIHVNANPIIGGMIEISTVQVAGANHPYDGVYFNNIPIPIHANANRGFVFSNWTGLVLSQNKSETIQLTAGDHQLTAHFISGSVSEANIVINEINYNSPDDVNSEDWVELHNPNNFAVDISGWYFEDESGRFFGLPANTILAGNAFLVLVEDVNKFTSVYPDVQNIVGDFGRDPNGFGLSGGGELLTLKNANGLLIDEVAYDDKSPWPEAADGDGPTLQLIAPDLNNALPENWTAIPATPGKENGVSSGCSLTYQTTAGNITISGLSDTHIILKIFDHNWNIVFQCFDNCNNPQIISGLATGEYFVSIRTYNANWQDKCNLQEFFTIGGGGCVDNDNDGICQNQDCNDGDPNLPTVAGTPCDDENPDTEDDVIQEDGCTCKGTLQNTGTPIEIECGLNYLTTDSELILNGSTAPHSIISLFNEHWTSEVFTCVNNCDNPLVITDLVPGIYHLKVKLYDENWNKACDLIETVTIDDPTLLQMNSNNLFYLKAQRIRNEVQLYWVIKITAGSDYFTIERSSDGEQFITMSETESGSLSDTPVGLQYKDLEPLEGLNFYRIKEVFANGTYRYSNVEKIYLKKKPYLKLFPNPSDNILFIDFKNNPDEKIRIEIYNQIGVLVKTVNPGELTGSPIPVDVADLPGGVYFLNISNGTKKFYNNKFVKLKL